MTRNNLSVWVVYDRPKDYPDKVVARMWETPAEGAKPTASIIICPDLETLRAQLIEMGLTCITRSPSDPPQVVESWI